jgi:hypothetical protein
VTFPYCVRLRWLRRCCDEADAPPPLTDCALLSSKSSVMRLLPSNSAPFRPLAALKKKQMLMQVLSLLRKNVKSQAMRKVPCVSPLRLLECLESDVNSLGFWVLAGYRITFLDISILLQQRLNIAKVCVLRNSADDDLCSLAAFEKRKTVEYRSD